MTDHLICTPDGRALTAKMLRDRFEKARLAAAEWAEGVQLPGLVQRIEEFQFRDNRPKAATEIDIWIMQASCSGTPTLVSRNASIAARES